MSQRLLDFERDLQNCEEFAGVCRVWQISGLIDIDWQILEDRWRDSIISVVIARDGQSSAEIGRVPQN